MEQAAQMIRNNALNCEKIKVKKLHPEKDSHITSDLKSSIPDHYGISSIKYHVSNKRRSSISATPLTTRPE